MTKRKRARITITLNTQLLKKIDQLKTRHNLTNRSQTIEELLNQSLRPSINTAVILAGGSENKGKILLKKINNQYLFATILEHLKQYGIKRVIVSTAEAMKPLLESRFGDGEKFSVQISYVTESTPLGTAGAIKNVDYLLGKKPFLVIHGDVLTNLNLYDFFEFHLREDVDVTIGVKPRMGEKKYGQVFLQGNKIIKFLEISTHQGISIINTGLYVINPTVLKRIPRNKQTFLETDIFPKLAQENRLGAFIFQGSWYDISDRQSLIEAMARWR